MNTQTTNDPLRLRRCIQKVATGPEYSKDLSFDEAYTAMQDILTGTADPVQTAVFLIALRMKRETDDENAGILQAILDHIPTTPVAVDHLVDIADPYDGYTRSVPMVSFLPAVLAACKVPAVAHGVASVGPKYGLTHHKVLQLAGIPIDLSANAAAQQIATADIGWAYIDQTQFCPALHELIPLRTRIVKRPVLTTIEVLTCPLRARQQTHLLTGYVHKAYPPVYANLARRANFDSAMIVRGVEGGVVPSLKQPAKVFEYYDKKEETLRETDPTAIGIEQTTRGIPVPDNLPAPATAGDEIAPEIDIDALARVCLEIGLTALQGKPGPAYNALVYAGAIVLTHLGRCDSMTAAADIIKDTLDSGTAEAHFNAAKR